MRVYRDELVEFQVDGTHGSAVAGLRTCVAQQRAHTPKPVWNPDLPVTEPFRDQWLEVPANADLDNGFKLQWEEFIRDVVAGREHRYDLLSAARGVQLAEAGLASSARGPPRRAGADRPVTRLVPQHGDHQARDARRGGRRRRSCRADRRRALARPGGRGRHGAGGEAHP